MYTILHTCKYMYVCTLCFEIQCLLTHPNRAERLQGFSLLPLRLVDAQEVQHLAQLGPPRAGVFQQLVLHKEIVRGLEVPLDACSHIQIHTYIHIYIHTNKVTCLDSFTHLHDAPTTLSGTCSPRRQRLPDIKCRLE